MTAPLRNVPKGAQDLIKSFEGIPDGDPATVNIDAYLCPAGVWTIGWGHAIVDNGVQLKGAANQARARQLYPGGITRAQASALLKADLIPRAASVSSLLQVKVGSAQFGALTSDQRFQYTTINARFQSVNDPGDRLPTGESLESLFYWRRASFRHLSVNLGPAQVGLFEATLWKSIDSTGIISPIMPLSTTYLAVCTAAPRKVSGAAPR